MTRSMKGRTVIVTGAAGGIGAAIAHSLHEAGADLILIDRQFEGLPFELENAERTGSIQQIDLDLTDASVTDRLDQEIPAARKIDGLVNVAGIHRIVSFVDFPLDAYDAIMAVNLRSAFVLTQWAARRMIRNMAGSIVSISSTSARVPRVRQSAYCASKAALSQLMRVAGLELAEHGIRVNTVAPGATDTAMIRQMNEAMSFEQEVLSGSLADFRPGIPLGKMAVPEDIAAAALFLLSDAAGHITMHELTVDGGGALG